MNYIFWGLGLIIIGAIILLNSVLNLNIPVGKLILSTFLIYLGIKVLMPSNHKKYCCSYTSYTKIEKSDNWQEYNVSFGSNKVNLKDLSESKDIYINARFAHVDVLLPEKVPYTIHIKQVFSEVNPHQNLDCKNEQQNVVKIFIDAAFANVRLK